MKQPPIEKLRVRLLVSKTLVEDLFHDWATLVEHELEDGNEDVRLLYNRCREYIDTADRWGDFARRNNAHN